MERHCRRACFLHAVRETAVLASADCEAIASLVYRLFLAWAGSSGWHVPGNLAFFKDLQVMASVTHERMF